MKMAIIRLLLRARNGTIYQGACLIVSDAAGELSKDGFALSRFR